MGYSFYKHVVITRKGYEFYSRIIAGEKLKFTKVELGSGGLRSDTNIEELTSLIEYKMTCEVSAVTQEHTQATVHINLTSDDVNEPFAFREVGIYAQIEDEEVLYAYLHTGDKLDYLAPSTDGQVFTQKLQFVISVGKAENVEVIFGDTTIVDGSITMSMFNREVKTYIDDIKNKGEANESNIAEHTEKNILSESGSHGLRYDESSQTLSYSKDEE